MQSINIIHIHPSRAGPHGTALHVEEICRADASFGPSLGLQVVEHTAGSFRSHGRGRAAPSGDDDGSEISKSRAGILVILCAQRMFKDGACWKYDLPHVSHVDVR